MARMHDLINSKSKTFLAFCFSFLVGVAAASLIDKRSDFVYVYGSFFLVAALAIAVWKKKLFRFFVFLIFCFLVGFARYQMAFPFSNQDISALNGRTATIQGYVADEPDVRTDGVRYVVTLLPPSLPAFGRGPLLGQEGRVATGHVYVVSELYPRYRYGDRLELHCDLAAPKPIVDRNNPDRVFRYDMYLARYGVFSLCRNPQIKKVGDGEGNAFFSFLFQLKEIIGDRMGTLWHEPYAGFMAGLLYGYRGGLGTLNDAFARTGVTHSVAISGFNIAIILAALMTSLTRLWIPRQKAFYILTAGLVIFILFAGASGSVLRAGVMAFLVLFAKQVGRLSRMANVLVATAGLLVLFNPFILVWDIGFQLSFLSTWGIVYLAPILERYAEKIPEFFSLKSAFTTTIAAIIATLPLILFQFGRLSIVAPVVNVLILWIIPWLMLAGFVSLIASFLSLTLGYWLSSIGYIGMKYVITVVHFFATLPFAAVSFAFPWWGMAIMYAALGAMYFKLCKLDKKI